jgi:hypothetical protein
MRQRWLEGQDCGERRRTVSRAGLDLACCGAGHQADPLSTGRQDALPRSLLEGSAVGHRRAEAAPSRAGSKRNEESLDRTLHAAEPRRRAPARRNACTSIPALPRSPSCPSDCIGCTYRYVSALTDSANESDILCSIIQNAILRHYRLRADSEIVFLLKCSIDIPRRVTIREHDNGRR